MRGKNVGVCHICRSRWHSFEECMRKRRCPWCPQGFQKCFEVEKETRNKGKLFYTYSNKCGYFDWVEGESSGESSNVTEVTNGAANGEVEDLPSMLDTLARITEKRDVEVSLNVTFRRGNRSLEGNGKGTGPA